MENTQQMEEPKVLTANTFYWQPSSPGTVRDWKSKKITDDVISYFKWLGFEVFECDGITCFTYNDIQAEFKYSESSKHVYKTFRVWRGDKKSNITQIRKIHKALIDKLSIAVA